MNTMKWYFVFAGVALVGLCVSEAYKAHLEHELKVEELRQKPCVEKVNNE